MLPVKLFPSDTFQESAFYFTHFPRTIDWAMVPFKIKKFKIKKIKIRKKSLETKLTKKNLGKKTQILSWQRSPTLLSHTVDRGSSVLHVREFLWSGPWAVSSNSQWAALGHLLVTHSRPRLTCAPREGVFVERSLGSQLKFSVGSAWSSPCHT